MDADPRAQEVSALLSQISKEVGKQRYESARGLLVQLVDKLGEDDPEVTRIRTLLDSLTDLSLYRLSQVFLRGNVGIVAP